MSQLTRSMISNKKTPMARFLDVLKKAGLFSLPGVIIYPLLSISFLLAPIVYMTITFGAKAMLRGTLDS